MIGFLGHLIQRSLNERTVLRPRPVSVFEPLPPPFVPATSQAPAFELDPSPAVDVPLPIRGRLAAALDLVAPSATAVEEAALPVDAELRQPASAPAARKAAIPFVEEMTLPTSKQAEVGRTKPTLPQHPLGESPPRAAARSDLFDQPLALPLRRLQVQGKMPTHPDSQPGFERPSAPAQPSAPLAPVQAVARSASPQRSEAAESAVRSAASASEPLLTLPRKEPAAPAQAILVPRLPQQPVVQPMQSVVSKPEEPFVHVTIGRVEIRAVSAPAAPKRPAPSKPALSLSDYLDRRSEGPK